MKLITSLDGLVFELLEMFKTEKEEIDIDQVLHCFNR